ncbi:MAG: copper resistance protein CopC [Actinomycetota bacterium]
MRRFLVLVGVVTLCLTLPAPSASAHALLRSSTPEDGAILEAVPERVVMVFTEPPDGKLSEVQVLDQSGNALDIGDPDFVSGEANTVAVSLPALEEGVYTVSWRVLSRVDGHLTAGAFSFGVGVEPEALAAARPAESSPGIAAGPSPLAVAGRWGFYWGLALLAGAAAGALFVFRQPLRRGSVLLGAAWAVAAVGLVAMFWAERSSAGASTLDLVASDRGRLLVARGIALGLVGLGVAAVALRPGVRAGALLGATTGVAMLVHAYAGHAGAGSSWWWFDVGIQWLHIVAVGVWIGGLVWLLAGTVGRVPDDRPQAVKRFSLLAGYALGAVALTGLLRGIDEVGSVGRLVDTGFGLSLVGKTTLFAALAGLGAINRYRMVPRIVSGNPGFAGLHRTVGAEIMLAAGILGLTGLLTELTPPSSVSAARAPAPQRVVVTGHDFGTTVRVELAATPGIPGRNSFEVRIEDFDSGEPVPARMVSLRFTLPERPGVGVSELELSEGREGVWRGTGTNLSLPGTWRVGVLIEQAADSLEVPLEVETGAPHDAPDHSGEVIPGGPGHPTIHNIELDTGRSVQGFVDPGSPGANEVHFTFLTPEGGELPIAEASVAMLSNGEEVELEMRRLSAGHYVANVSLEPGRWRFEVEATAEDGSVLAAGFEQDIEG